MVEERAYLYQTESLVLMPFQGKRREDITFGLFPEDPQPGDYWKYLNRDTKEPMKVHEDGNLTGTIWGICSPLGGIGTLRKHTVREHEDGTISVRPGDGSSNSIVVQSRGKQFHGYIEHGIWKDVSEGG